MSNTETKRLNLVQLSRGLVMIIILLFHANSIFKAKYMYDWLNIGSWGRTGGVDFFFVISGFMIFYLYSKYFGNKSKSIDFLKKRFIRLFPVYWIVLFGLILLLFLFPQLGNSTNLTLSTIFKNIVLYPNNTILVVTWSLSYVVFFYILFSLLMAFPKIVKISTLIWLALCLITLFIYGYDQPFILNFQHLELWAGALVAYIVLNKEIYYKKTFLILGFLGYILIWINSIFSIVSLYSPLFYCISSMLIMISISSMDMGKSYNIPRPFSFLGDASYSIYITHSPLLQFFTLFFDKFGLLRTFGYSLSMVFVSILTIIFSCIFYIIIEKPLIRFLNKKTILKVNISFQKTNEL